MQLHEQQEDSDIELDDNNEKDVSESVSDKLRQNCLRNHRLPLTCVCIDSRNEHAYSGSKDGSIIKWCLATNKVLAKIQPIKKKLAESNKELGEKYHTNHINCIAISSDDKFLATGGGDPKIRIWSPKDMTWLHTFNLHRKEVTTLAFRRGHHVLYSGSVDKSVMLWTLEDDDNRCFVEALYGHESPITSMDTLNKERVLTSGGRDQSIRIWKIVEQAQTVFQSKHESVDIARYIDDKTFVSGGEDGSITVWTTMKRSPICTVNKAHGSSKNSKITNGDCPFSRNLSFWISSLAVYPMKQAKKQGEGSNKRRKIDDVRFEKVQHDEEDEDSAKSGDESDGDEDVPGQIDDTDDATTTDNCLALIASGSCDSQLLIWKLTKDKGKVELKEHQTIDCPGFINDLRFTSDGQKIIAACGQEHRLGRWWKLKGTKNCLRTFEVNKI